MIHDPILKNTTEEEPGHAVEENLLAVFPSITDVLYTVLFASKMGYSPISGISGYGPAHHHYFWRVECDPSKMKLPRS